MLKAGSANPNWRGGYEDVCTQCGARVWIKPSRSNRKTHFCSKQCHNKWMSENQTKENCTAWRGGKVTKICQLCGKTMVLSKSDAKRGGKYCSAECVAKARTTKQICECSYCGKEIKLPPCRTKSKRNFCSYKCKHLSQIKERSPEEIAMKKLNLRISALMGYSLKGNKNGCKWENLVGYTLDDLKRHLESQFKEGMSWANIGNWHIDHIKPRCLFNYANANDAEFLECWSINNLQPLWAVENLSKGSKYQ